MFAHLPIIRDILHGAASRGADLMRLCRSLQISPEALSDSEKSVGFEQACRAWELAVKETGDSLLGLHLGETATPSILGLIGHLMQSSPDLLTAYQQVCKHASLATDMLVYSIDVGANETVLRYTPAKLWMDASPLSARQAVEQAMAGTLNVFYLLSGKRVLPERTELMFRAQRNEREYERIFLSSVKYGCKQNALFFHTRHLEKPVISYDKSLFELFDTLLRTKLEKLARQTSVSDQVRKILTQDFKGQIVSAGVVAAHLNMSVRTFQRKLTEEGTSYRALSTRLRKEFALLLLKSQRSGVQEVARMLGYSEASALRKALKR